MVSTGRGEHAPDLSGLAPAVLADTGLPARRLLSPQEHARLRRRYWLREQAVGWAFLAPAMVAFLLFLLIPAIGVVFWTFREGGITGKTQFVGLDNWADLASYPGAMAAFRNTLQLAVMSVPIFLVLAMVVALLLQRLTWGASVYRFLLYFPVLIPSVVAGVVWIFVTHTDVGPLNMTMRAVGMPPQIWLGQGLALFTLAMVEVWRNVGYWAIFFLAGLIGLPKDLYASAELDGAGPIQRLWRITLPLLRPIVVFAVVMATIWGLQVFDTVSVLTQGGPGTSSMTLVYFVYDAVFQNRDVGHGAAVAVVLMVVILALALTQFRALRGRAMT